jgi:hypothetical protein
MAHLVVGSHARCCQRAFSFLAFDYVNFYWLHVHTVFLEPFDGGFDFFALAVQFQAHDADFVRHACLADVGDHFELVAHLPDEWLLDEPGRIHQPQALLHGRGFFGRGNFFPGSHIF